jgi:hypothetical protein
MITAQDTVKGPPPVGAGWSAQLRVDVDSGLAAEVAAARLQRDGPNALPAEQPPSSPQRLLAQYGWEAGKWIVRQTAATEHPAIPVS